MSSANSQIRISDLHAKIDHLERELRQTRKLLARETHDSAAKRGVSMDEWCMLLQFCREIEPDTSNFQDDGAWPLLLDEFVEWRREKDAAK